MDNVKDILLILLPIATTSGCGYLVWYVKYIMTRKDIVSKSLMFLLRSEIRSLYNIHMERQYISVECLAEFEDIYETYKSLGGNGTATRLFEDIKKLQIKER